VRTPSVAALRRPLVLAHFPPLFAALAAAAAILAAAAAAAPMFVSETGTATLRVGLAAGRDRALVVAKDGPLTPDVAALRDAQVRASTAGLPALAEPTETLWGASAVRVAGPDGEDTVRLATKSGFESHLDAIGSAAEPGGVWLNQPAADRMGVSPGDPVTLTLEDRSAVVPVAGVFEASHADPFWTELLATVGGEGDPLPERVPASLAVLDRGSFLALTSELEEVGRQSWVFAIEPGADRTLSLDLAGELADGIQRFDRDSADPNVPLGTVLANPSVSDQVTAAVRAAEDGLATVTPPVETLALTGQLVALFGTVAAGVYGVRRRRIEMRYLDAKGITRRSLWVRSAVEAVLPVAVGGAIGWVVTWWTILRFGPTAAIEAAAVRTSIRLSVIACVVAIGIVATVTAMAAARQAHETVEATSRSRGAAVWWEIPLLVLAAAALYEIWTRGTSAVSSVGGRVEVDRLLLLFPVLFMAGCAGLVVRALGRLLLRLRGGGSWPVPLYLASRRLSTAPRVALLLVTASTLAIGVLAYAGTAVVTIRESTRAKVLGSTGADVVGNTPGPIFGAEAGSGLHSTNVFEIPFVRIDPTSETQLTLVGIEPDTFEAAAYWDPTFSDRPLDELLRDLAPQQEPLPAIVAGGELPSGEQHVQLSGYQLPLRVVGTAAAFPGQARGLVVVVSAPALRSVLEEHDATVALGGAHYRAWADGPPGLARAFLITSGADPGSIVIAADLLQTPALRALTWAFVFMELIGVVTAVIALIGLVLYLQARQRSRELSYALGRRMGMTSGAHRAAVVIEILLLLVTALVAGAVLALGATALIYRRLDPLPDLPPDLTLSVPGSLLLTIGAAIAVCAAVGGWWVQHRAERANVGAVLRFDE
jgi:putative ABC transport system permease protein